MCNDLSLILQYIFGTDVLADLSRDSVGRLQRTISVLGPRNLVTIHLGKYKLGVITKVNVTFFDGLQRRRPALEDV